jgi:aminoglycoside phosphotransferase (APT) family kinase protein
MEFETRIAEYLMYRNPGGGRVTIDQFARIHGGSSQQTYRLRATWHKEGLKSEQRLVLRRPHEAGMVEADNDLEYLVYSALNEAAIPVPVPHYMEQDPEWLERPFLIMDMMPGKPGHFYLPGDPYDGKGDQVARAFWRHLGDLAKLDHRQPGLDRLRGADTPAPHWQCELDFWQDTLDAAESGVEPAVRGAIRWLRRNPPPAPAKSAICHGDYRSGNFLFLDDGSISAVLDWEMCHVSDPLEDVAWAINPMWTMERHLPLAEGLAIWEDASGLTIDPAALDWWRLFTAVKCCGLWTNAEASFEEGINREMSIALTAVRATHFHHMEILDRMEALGAMA